MGEMLEIQGFELIETADGSPSLTISTGESMHNKKGAFSETMEIYLPAFSKIYSEQTPFSTMVVGFGLGYVEMALAAWAASNQSNSGHCLIESVVSYEIVPELYQKFNRFLAGEPSSTYQTILDLNAEYFKINPQQIVDQLQQWLDEKKWQQKTDLLADENIVPAHVIVFDPFSANTDSPLWEEQFLLYFLNSATRGKCVFTTYAAKGVLKRGLEANGFTVTRPQGFAGKRQRTWALKGV